MAMMFNSVPGRTLSSIRHIVTLQKQLLMSKLAQIWSSTDASFSTTEAIEILGSNDASPDMRDWAEHHLCGLAQSDKMQFFKSRRWQS